MPQQKKLEDNTGKIVTRNDNTENVSCNSM